MSAISPVALAGYAWFPLVCQGTAGVALHRWHSLCNERPGTAGIATPGSASPQNELRRRYRAARKGSSSNGPAGIPRLVSDELGTALQSAAGIAHLGKSSQGEVRFGSAGIAAFRTLAIGDAGLASYRKIGSGTAGVAAQRSVWRGETAQVAHPIERRDADRRGHAGIAAYRAVLNDDATQVAQGFYCQRGDLRSNAGRACSRSSVLGQERHGRQLYACHGMTALSGARQVSPVVALKVRNGDRSQGRRRFDPLGTEAYRIAGIQSNRKTVYRDSRSREAGVATHVLAITWLGLAGGTPLVVASCRSAMQCTAGTAGIARLGSDTQSPATQARLRSPVRGMLSPGDASQALSGMARRVSTWRRLATQAVKRRPAHGFAGNCTAGLATHGEARRGDARQASLAPVTWGLARQAVAWQAKRRTAAHGGTWQACRGYEWSRTQPYRNAGKSRQHQAWHATARQAKLRVSGHAQETPGRLGSSPKRVTRLGLSTQSVAGTAHRAGNAQRSTP